MVSQREIQRAKARDDYMLDFYRKESIAKHTGGILERQTEGKGYARSGTAQLLSSTVTFGNWIKGFLIIGLIIFIIIGPGLGAISAIASALTWWMWIGLILLGLMIWRSRR